MTDREPPSVDAPAVLDAPDALDPRDASAARGLGRVAAIYVNDSRWWQNASFALPLLGFAISTGAGVILGSAEATGFGLFLGVVTLIMLPVVLLTWRGTATAIVLTDAGATALHHGQPLHELRWDELRRIERVEYLGNVRHKLVHGDEDRFLTVESEIENALELIDRAFALSGLPRGGEAGTSRG
jgi:hypothetical protein